MIGARLIFPLFCLSVLGCNAGDVVLYTRADAGDSSAAGAGAGDAAGLAGSSGADDAGAPVGGSGGAPNGASGTGGGSTLPPVDDAGPIMTDAGDESDAGDAGPPDGSTPCFSNADCPASWFCSKASCEDMSGSCSPRPLICDANVMPVCGCDHVTYWNTCLREDYGVSADKPGECGSNAKACNSAADCGTVGASCAHLLPSMAGCSGFGEGTCWATPNDCATGLDIRHWQACPQTGQGTQAACVSTCSAIQSGQLYIQTPRGVACN